MDVFDLQASLSLDKSDYDSGLSEAQSAIGTFGSKIGGMLQGAMQYIPAVAEKVAGAVKALTSKTIENYSAYEQLVGGVETLFGTQGKSLKEYAKSSGKSVDEVKKKYKTLMKAQEIALKNASEAYKTAGMDQNAYMETITSFAAALKQSTKNEVEAAKVADVAIQDMSDNASKMGSSMESIQNAYQGFAKQNYQMLDNLKLGYGGTKEEMKRLLDDAQKLTGIKYDINNLSDVYSAIHVIQTDLGITGTTAKEAMYTIEGSARMTKSAWENVVTAIGKGEGLSEALDGFVEAIFGTTEGSGLLNQVIPRIATFFEGLGKFVESAGPYIVDRIPALLATIIPSLTKTLGSALSVIGQTVNIAFSEMFTPDTINRLSQKGFDAISGLIDGFREGLPNIISTAQEFIGNLFDNLSVGLNNLTALGVDLIGALGDGISQAIPELLPTALNALVTFSGQLRENAGQLVDAGLEMILKLADGLINSIPILIETVPQIVTNIAGIINDNAPKVLETGITIIQHLVQGIIDAIPTLVENIPQIVTAIVNVIMAFNWLNLGKNIITFIKNGISILKESVPSLMKNIGEKALNFFKSIDWVGLGKSVISFIGSAIRGAIGVVTGALRSVGQTGLNTFRNINWLGLGKTVINFIGSAIRGAMGFVVNALKTVGNNALTAFRNIDWAKVATTVIRLIGEAQTRAKDFVVKALKSVGMNALNAFKNINWKGLGSAVVDGIKNGITNGAKKVADAARSLASRAFNAAKDFLGIHSPAKKGIWLGEMFTRGIALGEDDRMPVMRAVKTVKDMMEKAKAVISPIDVPIDGEIPQLPASMYTRKKQNGGGENEILKSIEAKLEKMIKAIEDLAEELGGMEIVLSNGTLVGELTPGINDELGLAEVLAARGV